MSDPNKPAGDPTKNTARKISFNRTAPILAPPDLRIEPGVRPLARSRDEPRLPKPSDPRQGKRSLLRIISEFAASFTAMAAVGGAAVPAQPAPTVHVAPDNNQNHNQGSLDNSSDGFSRHLKEALHHLADLILDKAEEFAVGAVLGEVGRRIWQALFKREAASNSAVEKVLDSFRELANDPAKKFATPPSTDIPLSLFRDKSDEGRKKLDAAVTRASRFGFSFSRSPEVNDLLTLALLIGLCELEHPSSQTVLAPEPEKKQAESFGRSVVIKIAEEARTALCGESGLISKVKDVTADDIAHRIHTAFFTQASTSVAAYAIAGAAVFIAAQGLDRFCTSGSQD